MTPAAPRFISAASTDPGLVRSNNEDRVYADETRGFFMVIDGMGGHAAGEEAAAIAVERVRTRLERQTDGTEQRVREAITLANNAIYEAAQSREEWKGMACVLTVAVIDNGDVVVGHVGDSRLYKIRGGEIEKVTHDHSPVGEREDSGELSETDAMAHPRRNEVYRDVGSEEHTPDDEDFIEVTRIAFEPDSALLLCSDGLSDVLRSSEILAIVQAHAGEPSEAVKALIAAANENSKDNVSAVLVEGPEFARKQISARKTVQPLASRRYRLRWYVVAFLVGVVAGAAGVLAYNRLTPQPHVPRTITVLPGATISQALDRAVAGDTVVVSPGIYIETVHLKTGVNVIAQRPHESIIDGEVIAQGVTHARIEGLNIRAQTIGIEIQDSNVDVFRCDVTGASTAGIVVSGNSGGSLVGNTIHDNPGVALRIAETAKPTLENNTISEPKRGNP